MDLTRTPDAAARALYLREEELIAGLQLFGDARAALTRHGEAIAAREGLAPAELRMMDTIARRPGLGFGELLSALSVTKQSAHRVLRGLMGRDLVRQRADGADGRRRRLYLSADGEGLVHKISARRTRRLAAAYRLAGPEAVAGFRAVLAALAQTRRNEE